MIVDSLVRRFRNTTYRNPDQWFLDWFNGGQESDSGVYVNAHNALMFSPYWQAISIISGDIGTISCPLYRRLTEGKKHVGRERDTAHPSYRLMLHEWNDVMTADVGKEVIQSHALSWGNGRAVIVRDARMQPMALVPLLPDRTDTKVVDGQVFHVTRVGESQEPKVYTDRDVLHIKGLGFDGIEGYSVASMARNSLGLGIAAEKHGSRTFKNFAIPPIVLETDTRVGPEDAKRLLADWERFHGGADNVGKTGLLHSGIKAHMLSMPNRDAQWLELRKFQRTEIAGWFNLPPHMLGDDSRVSYNSLEQENAKYLSGCLLRWFIRWQLECRRKLLTEREKAADSHYFEFLADMLVSVDFAAKVEGINKLIAATVLSPNEAREMLNRNHREGGDVFENPNTSKGEAPEPREPTQGPPGRDGRDGTDGKDGRGVRRAAIDEAGVLHLEYTDGAIEPLSKVVGSDGINGKDGTDGIDGTNGVDGRGIVAVSLEGGSLQVQFTDESTQLVGPVVGRDGTDGKDGRDGERGPKGESGEPSFYGRCLDNISAAIEKEVLSVRHFAGHSKNFTGWFESWYPKWQKKMAADLERLGADAAIAEEHCAESLRQLVEMTENATMQTLVDDVTKLTAAWHERGVRLARRLAGNDRPALALEVETMVSTPHGLGKITAIESGWRYQVELQDGSTLPVDGKDIEVLG